MDARLRPGFLARPPPPRGRGHADKGVRSDLTGRDGATDVRPEKHLGECSPRPQSAADAKGAGLVVAPRVLVDATAVPADRGAHGRYVDGLVCALGAAGADLAVACQRADEERYSRLVPGARVVAAPPAIAHRPARLAWEQSGLPLVAQQVNADVIHSPHYSMPLRPGVPTVVTVHDLTFFTEPDAHSPLTATFYKAAIRTSARRATRLIVPSKATRDELVRVLGPDPTSIDVAYHGVDHRLFHRPDAQKLEQVGSRLGLHGQSYVAYLGTLEPRKNVPALIEGWAAAVADLPDPPALVLAGGSGWSDEVDDAVAKVPAHLRIVRPGYLHFTDLPGYFGGAQVVAFPSIGEGFGLPVLEAMACGAPVLTTHRTSLPEVGGDAVAYTEPEVSAITTTLRALLLDPDRRATLGDAGHARSREFTWATSAEAHMVSYERAAAQGAE
jgi:glycosyltransferase involved in cell wall biosynthesis